MGQIKYQISGDASKAIAELQKVINKQEAIAEKWRKVAQAGKGAGRSTRGMFSKALGDIGKVTAALTGIYSVAQGLQLAFQQLRREYENIKSRQSSAAATRRTTEEAAALAITMRPQTLFPGSKGTDDLRKIVAEVSHATHLEQKTVWDAQPEALSTIGTLNKKQYTEAMVLSGKLRRAIGESFDMGQFQVAIQSVMGSLGGSAKGSMGWALQFGQQSAIKYINKQVLALAPTIASAKQFGVPAEQSAELLAFITHVTKDLEGRRSQTAATSMMAQVMSKKIMPQRAVIGGREVWDYAKAEGKTFAEKITHVRKFFAQATEEESDKFWDHFQTQYKTRGATMAYLTMKDDSSKDYMNTIERGITRPRGKEVEAETDTLFRDLALGKVRSDINIAQAGDVAKNTIELTNDRGAMAATLRKMLQDVFKAGGASDIEQKWITAKLEYFTNLGTKSRAEMAKYAKQTLTEGQESFGWGMPVIAHEVTQDTYLGTFPMRRRYRRAIPTEARQTRPGKWQIDYGEAFSAMANKDVPIFDTFERNPKVKWERVKAFDELQKTLDAVLENEKEEKKPPPISRGPAVSGKPATQDKNKTYGAELRKRIEAVINMGFVDKDEKRWLSENLPILNDTQGQSRFDLLSKANRIFQQGQRKFGWGQDYMRYSGEIGAAGTKKTYLSRLPMWATPSEFTPGLWERNIGKDHDLIFGNQDNRPEFKAAKALRESLRGELSAYPEAANWASGADADPFMPIEKAPGEDFSLIGAKLETLVDKMEGGLEVIVKDDARRPAPTGAMVGATGE